MTIRKAIIIDSCVNCPTSDIKDIVDDTGGAVYCCSGKFTEERYVGQVSKIMDENIIPEFCPLSDVEDAFKYLYKGEQE